ncbi:MogA/MoaB family molybdenum cofactor biosynthesis protein [Intrasporangium flavum]|uniref:MogA/MoaB family molybdenum cofactor biosynthesis protein n=1 Tax=Intrasporangium flavum TaxID=1428657 RepID=UPI00096DF852|nr:MogA/MoaB family molybdenum cofactor biosynthesis protein [Intrasporangium flavum]
MSDASAIGRGRRAVVVTASTRAAAGVYPDRSGPVIVERLRAWGFEVGHPFVVPDGDEFGWELRDVLASEPDLVLTTGGTGLTPTDVTPEQTAPLLDRLVPGVAEAIRAAGVAKGVPTAMLSRGLVGVAGQTFVANLPGSRGGVVDALDVLEQVLGHALDQIPGSDH